MPRKEHIISIFVSSPSDVEEERMRLKEVIQEINITWNRNLGIRLELIAWETHSYPGIGDDAQDVINDEIPNDYDIFIGIMWHRCGTPTKRSDSGTIEEFQIAKKRYDVDHSSVKIMMYFKDAPVPPSKIDPEQLEKVNAFRKSLSKEGVLYWMFNTVEDFERLLRIQLTRQVQSWHKKLKSIVPSPKIEEEGEIEIIPSSKTEDEEMGIHDLIKISVIKLKIFSDITKNIENYSKEFGNKIDNSHISDKKAIEPLNANRRESLIDLNKLAGYMDQYGAQVEAEIPLFGKNLNEGLDAIIKLAKISVDVNITETDKKEYEKVLDKIVSLNHALNYTEGNFKNFRSSIADSPPFSSIFIKSKKKVISVLDRLIEEFRKGQSLIKETEYLLSDVIKP